MKRPLIQSFLASCVQTSGQTSNRAFLPANRVVSYSGQFTYFKKKHFPGPLFLRARTANLNHRTLQMVVLLAGYGAPLPLPFLVTAINLFYKLSSYQVCSLFNIINSWDCILIFRTSIIILEYLLLYFYLGFSLFVSDWWLSSIIDYPNSIMLQLIP